MQESPVDVCNIAIISYHAMGRALTALEIEAKARKAGLPIRALCKRAEISVTTFWRWKAGKHSPSIEIYRRLYEAVEGTPTSPTLRRGNKNGRLTS